MDMSNKFKQAIHNNIEIALSEYEKLANLYEDVRMEKMNLVGETFYFINYRYPIKTGTAK